MAKKEKKAAAEEAAPSGPPPTPRLLEQLRTGSAAGLGEEARPQKPDVAAATGKNRREHGRRQCCGREKKPGRCRGGADANHRPKAAGDQGPKKAIAGFKLREGLQIGCKVTLRGARMYEFLDRLVSLALPRVRDFRGLDPNSFDGQGNYSLGLSEQLVFPELNPDKFTACARHERHDCDFGAQQRRIARIAARRWACRSKWKKKRQRRAQLTHGVMQHQNTRRVDTRHIDTGN